MCILRKTEFDSILKNNPVIAAKIAEIIAQRKIDLLQLELKKRQEIDKQRLLLEAGHVVVPIPQQKI